MKRICLTISLLVLTSLSALAQETPKVELFGGYAYAGDGSHGFAASVTGNVNSYLGLVAEIGGQYSHFEEEGIRESISAPSVLFGPRFSLRRNRRLTPFAHALFGASHIRSEATELGQTFIFSDTSFAMAIGGGLDVRVSDNIAIRIIQVDYLRTHHFNETQNKGRIVAGVVLRFGKK
jgi:opacity protein-like surface antigen